MARRIFEVDGQEWQVAPSGRTTQYGRDEFGVIFRRVRDDGTVAEQRMSRYSPRGTRARDLSLARMDDDALRRMRAHSQPAFTAPELGYRR
jgi:hypothetical protein